MSVLGEGVRPQVNKFEQVSSDDHQMSVAEGRGYPGSYVGGGYPGSDVQIGGFLPCDLSHDARDVAYPLNGMTDR